MLRVPRRKRSKKIITKKNLQRFISGGRYFLDGEIRNIQSHYILCVRIEFSGNNRTTGIRSFAKLFVKLLTR